MKILCQIVLVEPLSLLVSLSNQLFGHIPITQISSEFTTLLEKIDESVDEEEEGSEGEEDTSKQQHKIPDLADIFRPGQYLRAIVTEVHAPGTTDNLGLGRPKDGSQRVSRRVELSIEPHKVNGGTAVKDLTPGFVSVTPGVRSYRLKNPEGAVSSHQERRGPRVHPRHWDPGRLWFFVIQGDREDSRSDVSSWSARGRLCHEAFQQSTDM